MTRYAIEAEILKRLLEIKAMMAKYCPEDGYLTMHITNETIHMNNAYWEHPQKGVIELSQFSDGTLHRLN